MQEFNPLLSPGDVTAARPFSRARRYETLSEKFRRHLKDGSWAPGVKIPTLRELASRFDVSTNTVRNAIRVLEREGSLYHVPAVGTFVRPVHHSHVITDQIVIALLTPDLGSSHVMEVARGVEQACQERRWRLQVYDSRLDPRLELDNLNRLLDSGTRGAVLFPTGDASTVEAMFKLKLGGFPLVLVDRSIHGLIVDKVESDHEGGAYLAVEHLIQAGHRRIFLHAGARNVVSAVAQRIRGYERALYEVGAKPAPEWFIWSDPVTPQDLAEGGCGRWFRAYEGAVQAFKSVDLPTAVFAVTAYDAVGTLRACQELGIKVPDDVSIVCFDDNEISRAMLPPLTYVAQRPVELGCKALELLEHRLQSSSAAPQDLIIDVELVKRGSVAPPRAVRPATP
jgi:DNA-binding LacI/PurR family transcriptional regulator